MFCHSPPTARVLCCVLLALIALSPTLASAQDPPPPTDLPPEALTLPPEFLEILPTNVKRVLIGEDYTEFKKLCPDNTLDALLACIERPDVSSALDDLLAVRTIDSLLIIMDAEIPQRLQPDHYAALVQLCEAPADAWMECHLTVDYVTKPALQEKLAAAADKEAVQSELDALETTCDESEEIFASCLAENDIINELYLSIQEDKKATFGKEIFIEYAGVLSSLTVDEIKTLREACNQTEPDAAKACFQNHPAIKDELEYNALITEFLMGEIAADLESKGTPLSPESRDVLSARIFGLFLTLPGKTINSLYRACEQKDPALKELASEESVYLLLDCIDGEAQEDPVANPAFISKEKLLGWINIGEEKVLNKIREKAAASEARNNSIIINILIIIAVVGGLVLLLMPLKLRKQYPGKDAIIWRAGALAAGTFVLTIVLLGASLLVMRGVQNSVAAEATNPQMRIAKGTFEILKREVTVENFSKLSKRGLDFMKTPLRKIAETTNKALAPKVESADGTAEAEGQQTAFIAVLATHWGEMLQEPEFKRIAQNIAMLKDQAKTFMTLIGVFKKVNWVMGYIPLVLSLVAVVFFLLPLKQTLVEILSAPARIASGQTDSATVFKQSMDSVKKEGYSLLPFLGVLLVFIPLTGVFMTYAIPPVVEVLLEYSVRTVFYLLGKEALASVLYASLGSAILLLVLVVAIYIVTTVFFLGSARKIMRLIYHNGHTWEQHKPLWIKGSILVLLALALPVVYTLGLDFIFGTFVRGEMKDLSGSEMVMLPLFGALLLPVFFWGARGLMALLYVKNYPVPFMPAPAPAAPPAAGK